MTRINRQKKAMLWINISGGIAVIGSYALGLATHPGQGAALWGNVPQRLRSLSTANMLPAALGFIAFTLFLLLTPHPETSRIKLPALFKVFNILYALILLPSALWMPLAISYLAHPSTIGWLTIRLVLDVVGLAGLGMLFALFRIQPRKPAWAFWLAVAGCIFFCIQTVVMDAILWSTFFLA
jgi:hypothetical protein